MYSYICMECGGEFDVELTEDLDFDEELEELCPDCKSENFVPDVDFGILLGEDSDVRECLLLLSELKYRGKSEKAKAMQKKLQKWGAMKAKNRIPDET